MVSGMGGEPGLELGTKAKLESKRDVSDLFEVGEDEKSLGRRGDEGRLSLNG